MGKVKEELKAGRWSKPGWAVVGGFLVFLVVGQGAASSLRPAHHAPVVSLPVELLESGCDDRFLPTVRLRMRQPRRPIELTARLGSDEQVRIVPHDPEASVDATTEMLLQFEYNHQLARVTPLYVTVGDQQWVLPARFSCVSPGNLVITRQTGSTEAFGSVDEQGEASCRSEAPAGWRGHLVAWRRPQGARPRELTDRRVLLYCGYVWARKGPPDLRPFAEALPVGTDYQVDAAVLGAMGNASRARAIEALADATDAHLGIVPRMPFNSAARSRVKLAVLDTAAVDFYSLAGSDTTDHGRQVGLLAHRTACGAAPGPCPVQIDNRVTMPLFPVATESGFVDFDFDTQRGGTVGTRGMLAMRLRQLVVQWSRHREQAPDDHLVVNISAAFHAMHDCQRPGCDKALNRAQPSELPVVGQAADSLQPGAEDDPVRTFEARSFATQALVAELAYARCLGVAVFAAAGNRNAQDTDGPALPGGFNRLRASPRKCAAGFGDAVPDASPRGPLVFAVGAVGHEGRRSALSRRRAMPRLAALGVGVAVRDPRRLAQGQTPAGDPLSGTSTATAIVSGAAAYLWSQRPELEPHELVQELYLASEPLAAGEELASLCVRGTRCPAVHEVTACTARRAVGGVCSVPRERPRLPKSALDALGPPQPQQFQSELPSVAARPGGPTDSEQGVAFTPSTAPFVQGQPGMPRCATCFVLSDSAGAQLQLDVVRVLDVDDPGLTWPLHGARFALTTDSVWTELSTDFLTQGWLQGTVDLPELPRASVLLETDHFEGSLLFSESTEVLAVEIAP